MRDQVGGGTPGPAIRVLVADDSLVHQAYARCVFEAYGCEVSTAANGCEAVAMAQAAAFDVILMDRRMPLCDGDTATRRIREAPGPSQQAMIICHAEAFPFDRAAALYDRFVAKPVTTYDIADLMPRGARAARFSIDLKQLRRREAA